MKTIFAALALAIPLAAYAEQPIQASNLSFSKVSQHAEWVTLPDNVGLTILSDQGGATTVTTSAWGSVLDLHVGSLSIGEYYTLGMTLNPKAGYVITGFSFTATVAGILNTPSGPPAGIPMSNFTPGFARNGAGIYLPDGDGNSVSKILTTYTTPTQYSFARNDLSIDSAKAFEFVTNAYVWAEYAHWSYPGGEGKAGSEAAIRLTDPRLTIYTALAPVPEPESWAMMLAGMALVGVVVRRRAAR